MVSITVPNYRHLNIEAATFAETVLTDAARWSSPGFVDTEWL
ncbi:MAG: hypothetical protein AAFU79_28635 [Myxococcota bacterium]